MRWLYDVINMTCVSWFDMMAGAIWLHFNDLRVNLVVMHYFVSYRDSNIIWCIDSGGNLREGDHRRECRRRRNEILLCQKGLYHIMLLWIAWDVYPLWCTLLDCAVVAFIRVISHLKYQVVSVLPSVAPSRHLSFRGAPWMHGYERLEKCEAGEVRPRSKITWLSWRSWQDRPELGTHASKDEQESHRDVIGKLAYRLKFPLWDDDSMAMNWSLDLVSLKINCERYWFEWERTVELTCLILSAINYEHCLSVSCKIVVE